MNTTLHYLLGKIKRTIKLARFQARWRKSNPHNSTCPVCVFPMDKVEVGNFSYGDLNVYTYRNKNEHLKIGCMCSIASNVTFVLGGEHSLNKLTTYPLLEKFANAVCETDSKGAITVGDDVWIGTGATILSGVTIGQGAVIGAGSIVTKDIPPYAIYVAGRIIRKRFSEELCERLLTLDYSMFNRENISDIYRYLGNQANSETIDNDLQQITQRVNLKRKETTE